jgi:hypothetical protein
MNQTVEDVCQGHPRRRWNMFNPSNKHRPIAQPMKKKKKKMLKMR